MLFNSLEKRKREKEEKLINVMKKEKKKREKMTSINGENYWLGPYETLIHESLDSCVAKDGINVLYKDGCETEVNVSRGLTGDEWLEKYAVEHDNLYFYKENPTLLTHLRKLTQEFSINKQEIKTLLEAEAKKGKNEASIENGNLNAIEEYLTREGLICKIVTSYSGKSLLVKW
jgi:hypothetical protein